MVDNTVDMDAVNDAMYSDEARTMLVDVSVLFEGQLGQKVMGYLETVSGAMHSLEPEEIVSRESGNAVPICPIGMAKRAGQKAFYWRLTAMKAEGDRLRKQGGERVISD